MKQKLRICPQCRSTSTKPKEGWPCAKCLRVAQVKQTPFVQDFVRSMFGRHSEHR